MQETWPAKLSAEKTAELRRRFEEDYPTELLDAEVFPSSRLLALTSKMVADKEIRWLAWCFRLSAKAQDDNLLIRPKKLPRLQELSDLLLDEAPTRDIHDGPASYNMTNQLLTLATNSIALCQGAHLGALKMYQKRFLRLCFSKYEAASNLRGLTSLEAQSADKRAWEIIAELVNQHSWKLDDALHEVSGARADLSSWLAPRATLPKQILQQQDAWAPQAPRPWQGQQPWRQGWQEQGRLPLFQGGSHCPSGQRGQRGLQGQGECTVRQVAHSAFHGWQEPHYACAFRVGPVKILPLAAYCIAVQCQSRTGQHVVVATLLHNMSLPRTRKPASAKRGTSLRRSWQSRFVFLRNRQDRKVLVSLPMATRARSPPEQSSFLSPLVCSFWRIPFPKHSLRHFPKTLPFQHQMLILTWVPSLSVLQSPELHQQISTLSLSTRHLVFDLHQSQCSHAAPH